MINLIHRFFWRRLHSRQVTAGEIKVYEEHRLTKAKRCRIISVERTRVIRE